MIRIYLSESIFSENPGDMSIALTIEEKDLKTFIRVALENGIDLAVLHDKEH